MLDDHAVAHQGHRGDEFSVRRAAVGRTEHLFRRHVRRKSDSVRARLHRAGKEITVRHADGEVRSQRVDVMEGFNLFFVQDPAARHQFFLMRPPAGDRIALIHAHGLMEIFPLLFQRLLLGQRGKHLFRPSEIGISRQAPARFVLGRGFAEADQRLSRRAGSRGNLLRVEPLVQPGLVRNDAEISALFTENEIAGSDQIIGHLGERLFALILITQLGEFSRAPEHDDALRAPLVSRARGFLRQIAAFDGTGDREGFAMLQIDA